MRFAAKRAFVAPKTAGQANVYAKLKQDFKGSGKFPAPAFLRVDKTILNTTGRYKFDIKAASGDVLPEKKLDRNDLFVTTHLGFFLAAQVSTKKGAEVLQSYPNETAFVAAIGFTPANLETIYNGLALLKVGSSVNIESMPMQLFRKVPETQQSAAANKSQWDIKKMCHQLETPLYLHGTASLEFEVEYPTFADPQMAAVAASTSNLLVMYHVGYLVKNGADPNKK